MSLLLHTQASFSCKAVSRLVGAMSANWHHIHCVELPVPALILDQMQARRGPAYLSPSAWL